jgi:hypothetical protein
MLIDDVEGRRRWRRAKHFNFRAKCAHAGNAGIFRRYSYCPKLLQGFFAR